LTEAEESRNEDLDFKKKNQERVHLLQYDGAIYEQQDAYGAAMGSPVFAVIPNLYLEDFEEQTLRETFPNPCNHSPLPSRFTYSCFGIPSSASSLQQATC
ncbi:unnamed protein product, partial [Porites evermanni]